MFRSNSQLGAWRVVKASAASIAMAIAFAVAVLFAIPPWIDFFDSGLGAHWDTKLMGQWMAYNAENILSGDFLFPNFNLNSFYPHADTLAFSEALWPQSYIYALFKTLGANPMYCFNATLLVFWAISGLCMVALLREFAVQPLFSFLGGLIFCLMPYRLAYYIEFNMSLCFVLPLVWLVYFRWWREPSRTNAVIATVAFFVALTSCIYYTVIALIPIALIFVAELRDEPRRLRDSRFLASLAIALIGVGLTAYFFLAPYAGLRATGEYVREAVDHNLHYLQPVHYIYPWSALSSYSALGLDIPKRPMRLSEVIAFPGSVLALLALAYWVDALTDRFRRIREGGRTALATAVEWLRALAAALFFFVVLLAWWQREAAAAIVYWSAAATLGLSLIVLLFPRPLAANIHADTQDKDYRMRRRLLRIGATSWLAFFISLGPSLTLGHDKTSIPLSPNPLGFAFEALPIFDALRALSRFAVVVLCFLVVAGVYTLDRYIKKPIAVVGVATLFAFALVYEGRQMYFPFKDQSANLESPTSLAIDALPPEVPIVQLPLGTRDADADAVFLTASTPRPLINGHSGFAPQYYLDWHEKIRDWDLAAINDTLLSVWPTPWLILNHKAINFYSEGWRTEFPYKFIDRHWELVVTDQFRSLYRPPTRDITEPRVSRWLRRDIFTARPVLRFEAEIDSADAQATARVSVNAVDAGEVTLQDGRHTYSLDISAATAGAGGQLTGDRVVIELSGMPSWRIGNIDFVANDD